MCQLSSSAADPLRACMLTISIYAESSVIIPIKRQCWNFEQHKRKPIGNDDEQTDLNVTTLILSDPSAAIEDHLSITALDGDDFNFWDQTCRKILVTSPCVVDHNFTSAQCLLTEHYTDESPQWTTAKIQIISESRQYNSLAATDVSSPPTLKPNARISSDATELP